MFWDNTYIDRSLSCQLEFEAAPISISQLLVISVCVSGSHLYRSVIVLSVRVRGCTYIDRPSPCHVSLCFWGCTYIDRPSPYHVSVYFWGRTYNDRSLSCQLEFGASPISIGHLFIISVCVSGPHLYRSVIVLLVRVQGRTYINRPSPCDVRLCF